MKVSMVGFNGIQSIRSGRPDRIQRILLVSGIFFALIVVIILFALLAGNGTKYLLLSAGAVAGLLGLFALYRLGRVEYGILTVILLASLGNIVALPTGYGSQIVFSLVMSASLIGLWLFQVFLRKGGPKLKSLPINLPMACYIAVSIFSYIWSNLLRDPQVNVWRSWPFVQLAALFVNLLLPVVALFIANKIDDVGWLKKLVWLTMIIGGFIITMTLLKVPFIHRFYDNGYRGLFGTWIGSLTLAMALLNEKLKFWQRGALLLVTGAWFFHDFYLHSDWFSGWLPLCVSLAIIILLRSRRLFFTLAVLGLLVFVIKFNFFYQRFFVANYYNQGGDQRVSLWKTNLNLVVRHPLFGVGPAGYAVYYMTYNPKDARSTHNNYFDVLAQTGIVGFCIFLWMMGTFGFTAYRTSKALSGKRNFEEALSVAALGGFAGAMTSMMLGDWVLPFAYNQTISGFDNAVFTWLFLGAMLVLFHKLKLHGEIKDL